MRCYSSLTQIYIHQSGLELDCKMDSQSYTTPQQCVLGEASHEASVSCCCEVVMFSEIQLH